MCTPDYAVLLRWAVEHHSWGCSNITHNGVGSNELPGASDHDFSGLSVTPSVKLFMDVPSGEDAALPGKWYAGQVYVHIKDQALQPSTPIKHATELAAAMRAAGRSGVKVCSQYCMEQWQLLLHRTLLCLLHPLRPMTPTSTYYKYVSFSGSLQVLVLKTDGGPDRNCTFASVQLAYLCLALYLNLDMLILLRTAPGQSYVNPVERVMSVLNLGIQGLALSRAECSPETENVLKGANSMKAIRQALTQADVGTPAGATSHTQQYTESMQQPISQIEEALEVSA